MEEEGEFKNARLRITLARRSAPARRHESRVTIHGIRIAECARLDEPAARLVGEAGVAEWALFGVGFFL
jgi:hypothetical protein